MRLALLHRSSNGSAAPASAAVWRTCLREITFLSESVDTSQLSGVIDGDDAYALLLEVLCGLRSPMLGETEVMAQFKAFLAGVPTSEHWIRRVGQRLLADAGDVREAHVRHLGQKSYASAVRRRVRGCERAAVIGTGQLAGQIVPLLLKAGIVVDQWGRRECFDDAHVGVTYRALSAIDAFETSDRAAVVVAAPAASEVIEAICGRYRAIARVVDLRGEADRPISGVNAPVDALAGIFSEIEAAQASVSRQCDAAREEIRRRSRAFGATQHVRPFGWEDLCA